MFFNFSYVRALIQIYYTIRERICLYRIILIIVYENSFQFFVRTCVKIEKLYGMITNA